MSAILELNDANFEREVLQSTKPVLVDFWAPWCGPCRQLAPVFEDAAQSFGDRVTFAKINTDDHAGLMNRYEVRGIPQLILFKEGAVVDRVVGFVPKRIIGEMLGVARDEAPTLELTDADLDGLENSPSLAILVCGEPNDGTYRTLLNAIAKAAKDIGNQAKAFACNTRNAPNIRERYDLLSTCVLLLRNGEVIDRLEGNATEEMLSSLLSSPEKVRSLPEVSEQNFRSRVLQSEMPVLVDACAATSGLYRRAFDIIQRAFSGRIDYAKLNVEESPHVASRYDLRIFGSCLLLFKGGRVVARLDGDVGSEFLSEEMVVSTLSAWESEPPAGIRDLTRSGREFRQQILQGGEPAFGYFGSAWMGTESRVMRLVAQRFPALKLFRLDAEQYNARNLEYMLRREVPKKAQDRLPPTIPERNEWFVLFKDGRVAYRYPSFARPLSQENDVLSGLEEQLG